MNQWHLVFCRDYVQKSVDSGKCAMAPDCLAREIQTLELILWGLGLSLVARK